jgi:hypothetical protein
MQCVDPLRLVPDPGNQAVIVSLDVKDRAITDRIGMTKAFPHLRETLPGGLARNIVPVQQRIFGVGMFFPKLPEFPFANYPQGFLSPHKLPFWEPLVKWKHSRFRAVRKRSCRQPVHSKKSILRMKTAFIDCAEANFLFVVAICIVLS